MPWIVSALFLGLVLLLPTPSQGQDAFPPVGDRYKSLPADAKSVVKSLKKLQARTEIGINFLDYNTAVSEAYPDVKIFVESTESKNLPELRTVLKNAMDCYLKVREIWSASIQSDSPTKKYEATVELLTARPALWRVAGANIAAAHALVESPQEELQKVQQTLIEGLDNLTVESGLALAKKQEASLLKGQKQNDGQPAKTESEDDAGPNPLKDLLFKDGDFGDAVQADEFTSDTAGFLTLNMEVPKKGMVPLSDGGRIVGFLFHNKTDAKKAYEAIAQQIGTDGRIATGLGEASWASRSPQNEKMDLVFRRDTYVIFIRAKSKALSDLTKRGKTIDSRLRKQRVAPEPN